MLGLAEPDAHRAYHRGYVARRYRRYQRSADSDVRPTLAKVSLTGREPSAAPLRRRAARGGLRPRGRPSAPAPTAPRRNPYHSLVLRWADLAAGVRRS